METKQWLNVTPEELKADAARKAAEWPTEAQRRGNISWTAKVPRPTAANWPYRLPSVQEAQDIWDAAEAARLQHQAAVEQLRANRTTKETTAIDKARADYVATEDAKLVDQLRRRFLASDPTATVADFDLALPDIRRQHRLDAALGRIPVADITSPITSLKIAG